MAEIGALFPTGGPVPLDRMIGRDDDLAHLVARLREGSHSLLAGPRRIGKTTVCKAACAKLERDHGFVAMTIEMPEQSSGAAFCNALVRTCVDVMPRGKLGRAAKRSATSLAEAVLESQFGLKLDLDVFTRSEIAPSDRRDVIELPLKVAREQEARIVLFIDEIQRAVDYADGEGLIADLVDVYAGQTEVTVLADGSEERVIERLMGKPYSFGKLATRHTLPEVIPLDFWFGPLRARFREAGLIIAEDRLAALLDFSAGEPFPTMLASSETAWYARQLGLSEVDEDCVERGMASARNRLDDSA